MGGHRRQGTHDILRRAELPPASPHSPPARYHHPWLVCFHLAVDSRGRFEGAFQVAPTRGEQAQMQLHFLTPPLSNTLAPHQGLDALPLVPDFFQVLPLLRGAVSKLTPATRPSLLAWCTARGSHTAISCTKRTGTLWLARRRHALNCSFTQGGAEAHPRGLQGFCVEVSGSAAAARREKGREPQPSEERAFANNFRVCNAINQVQSSTQNTTARRRRTLGKRWAREWVQTVPVGW